MSQPPPPPMPPSAVPFAEPVPMAYAIGDPADVRPGLVTALGVCSIIVSLVQAGWATLVTLMAFGALMISVAGTVRGGIPARRTAAVAPVAPARAMPAGMAMPQRRAIVRALTADAKLAAPHRDALDALLAEYGKDIAPTLSRTPAKRDEIEAYLEKAHRDAEGRDVLDVATGRITLGDDAATFEPAGSTAVISIDFTAASILPGSPAFDASRGAAATQPLPLRVGPTTVPMLSLPPINRPLVTAALIASIGSGLLSILLFIAGIFALRAHRSGRRLHLVWAWLKLPMAAIGAAGMVSLMHFFSDFSAMSRAGSTTPIARQPAETAMAYAMGGFPFVLGLAYIVAVVLVLRVAPVRAWFSTRP